MNLTHSAARSVHLATLGLLQPFPRPAARADLLAAIRRMGVLQIDTIHVVARSPYLVLFSRLGAYPPRWLEELLAEGALFEYWAHAACFIPREDYPLFRPSMERGRVGPGYSARWVQEHPQAVEAVLGHIRDHGPARSADFENGDKPASGWWNWKEEKQALEHLLNLGVLTVARRQTFQRVYDLTERVIPEAAVMDLPGPDQVHDALVEQTVRILGVSRPEWVADYYRLPKADARAAMRRLLAGGRLVEASVEGWPGPALFHPANLDLLRQAAAGELEATHTTLLSPFDPLTWDRQRARELFGFDYTIECYLPAEKRRYGYFSLPVLRRGALVGRLDAKAHRARGVFEIRALHWEPGLEPTPALHEDVRQAIERCAAWHETPEVAFSEQAQAAWGAD